MTIILNNSQRNVTLAKRLSLSNTNPWQEMWCQAFLSTTCEHVNGHSYFGWDLAWPNLADHQLAVLQNSFAPLLSIGLLWEVPDERGVGVIFFASLHVGAAQQLITGCEQKLLGHFQAFK